MVLVATIRSLGRSGNEPADIMDCSGCYNTEPRRTWLAISARLLKLKCNVLAFEVLNERSRILWRVMS